MPKMWWLQEPLDSNDDDDDDDDDDDVISEISIPCTISYKQIWSFLVQMHLFGADELGFYNNNNYYNLSFLPLSWGWVRVIQL